MNQQDTVNFIWSIAELLRGDYKQSDYGKVILPFTLLRRLDYVLADTRDAVCKEYEAKKDSGVALDFLLQKKSGYPFYNTSRLDFVKLLADAANIKDNLIAYINGFSDNIRDIFDRYDFRAQIERLEAANLLYQVVQKFVDAKVDLHPRTMRNADMGTMFEELIRRFAELSNETAGEHWTPRDVIKLMVTLLLNFDDKALTPATRVIRRVYDPAAGTGGMLSVTEEYVHEHNQDATIVAHGQELNPESYAVCKADMLIKGQDIANIAFGNTLSDDAFADNTFDYMLSNPPFGVDWKKVEKQVRDEHEKRGHAGRFGPGLPRVSDGSLLFLMHMLSKMKHAPKSEEEKSRVAIVLNGSPLFTGGAGSGESEIRRWIIEHDWLEAIIALPADMFYNTGIATYVWLLTNWKEDRRKGKIQLINAGDGYRKMRKSLGSKRKELAPEHIEAAAKLYGAFAESPQSKILPNEVFGYRTITVERPLRAANGKPEKDKKGKLKADSKRRDTENVPLLEDVEAYFKREVLPHAPDAWIDHAKTKTGYEIPFARHFYQYTPPRPLEDIDRDLKEVSAEIMELLKDVAA